MLGNQMNCRVQEMCWTLLLAKEAPCAHSHLQTTVQLSGGAQICKSHISVSKGLLGSPDMHIGGNSGQVQVHRVEFQPQVDRGQLCGQLWVILCYIYLLSGIVFVLDVGLVFSLDIRHPAQDRHEEMFAK